MSASGQPLDSHQTCFIVFDRCPSSRSRGIEQIDSFEKLRLRDSASSRRSVCATLDSEFVMVAAARMASEPPPSAGDLRGAAQPAASNHLASQGIPSREVLIDESPPGGNRPTRKPESWVSSCTACAIAPSIFRRAPWWATPETDMLFGRRTWACGLRLGPKEGRHRSRPRRCTADRAHRAGHERNANPGRDRPRPCRRSGGEELASSTTARAARQTRRLRPRGDLRRRSASTSITRSRTPRSPWERRSRRRSGQTWHRAIRLHSPHGRDAGFRRPRSLRDGRTSSSKARSARRSGRPSERTPHFF